MGRTRIANLPGRITAGAFILNAGVGKLRADAETAGRVHGMAAGTYPALEGMDAERFVKLLGVSEVALGGALLLPVVGDGVAGSALVAFAGGLLGLYVKTPGLRVEGSVRPSQQGTAIAKDVWLLGIGCSLVADSLHHSLLRRGRARARRRSGDKPLL
ncbi:MAG: hypothetical protein ACYDHU_08975 [Acidimicrobiales bacterium]